MKEPTIMGKAATAMAIASLLTAAAAHAGEAARIELWHDAGKRSAAKTVIVPCATDREDSSVVCAVDGAPPSSASSSAGDYFWIKIRGNAVAYWIRHGDCEAAEFGFDAGGAARLDRSMPCASSPALHFAITMPVRS
ncbi:MAG TPA: hypothetical protein VF472_16815 [Burkholderiaceae bacterium]